MKITLSKKNEEIFSKIPTKYRELIINTLLTKSFSNGELLKELNFYLSSSECEQIFNSLEIEEFEIKKSKRYYSKTKKQNNIKREIEAQVKKENEIDNVMIGFD